MGRARQSCGRVSAGSAFSYDGSDLYAYFGAGAGDARTDFTRTAVSTSNINVNNPATIVNYNGARVVHFWVMCALAAFVVPHVVLVIADGWDTFRSMVTGWSARQAKDGHGR